MNRKDLEYLAQFRETLEFRRKLEKDGYLNGDKNLLTRAKRAINSLIAVINHMQKTPEYQKLLKWKQTRYKESEKFIYISWKNEIDFHSAFIDNDSIGEPIYNHYYIFKVDENEREFKVSTWYNESSIESSFVYKHESNLNSNDISQLAKTLRERNYVKFDIVRGEKNE